MSETTLRSGGRSRYRKFSAPGTCRLKDISRSIDYGGVRKSVVYMHKGPEEKSKGGTLAFCRRVSEKSSKKLWQPDQQAINSSLY